jgi:hypothetical protein
VSRLAAAGPHRTLGDLENSGLAGVGMWGEQAMLPKTWIPNLRWYEVHVRVVRGDF